MKSIYLQAWEESERGWGVRPDGFSLHLTREDCDNYCRQYWIKESKKNYDTVPDEYSRQTGIPTLIAVEDFVFDALHKLKEQGTLGIRSYITDPNKANAFFNDKSNF
jgi:hypothetical protein